MSQFAYIDVIPEMLGEFMAMKPGSVRVDGSLESPPHAGCVRLEIDLGPDQPGGRYTAEIHDDGLTRKMTLKRVGDP